MLKKVLIIGSSWTLGLQLVKFIAQVLTMYILARILSPKDFGLIAMLASSFALLELLRDFGLNAALVQRATISNAQLVGIFYLTVMLGVIMSGVGVSVGYLVAWFTKEEAIRQIAPFMAICFITNSLSTVPLGILRRELKFKQLAIRDFFSYLLGALAGVVVAVQGGGYWALVAAALASSATNMIMVWSSAQWWPRSLALPFGELKPLLKLGGALTVGEFANYVNSNADNLLIGKFWGMLSLGYYNRGYALMLAPIGQIIGPLGAVIQPVMCRLHDDNSQMKNLISSISILFCGLAICLASFVLIAAPSVMPLVLGSGWDVSVKVVQWLSLSVFVRPIASLLYWSVVARGQSGTFMKWAGSNCAINLVAILIGLPYGPVGVARALGIASVLAVLPNAIFLSSEATHHSRSSWFALYFKSLLVFGAAACFAKLFGLFEVVGSNVWEFAFNTALAASLSLAAGSLFVGAHRSCRTMILSAYRKYLVPI